MYDFADYEADQQIKTSVSTRVLTQDDLYALNRIIDRLWGIMDRDCAEALERVRNAHWDEDGNYKC